MRLAHRPGSVTLLQRLDDYLRDKRTEVEKHLAAALRLPSVVVFHQLGERDGWPPLDRQRHRVVCSLGGITPEQVLAQARDLLRCFPRQQATPGSAEVVRCPSWTLPLASGDKH